MLAMAFITALGAAALWFRQQPMEREEQPQSLAGTPSLSRTQQQRLRLGQLDALKQKLLVLLR